MISAKEARERAEKATQNGIQKEISKNRTENRRSHSSGQKPCDIGWLFK